jgi:adenylate cyclase
MAPLEAYPTVWQDSSMIANPPYFLRTGMAAYLRAAILLVGLLISLWLQWLPPPAGSHFADEWLRDRFIVWRADPTPEQRFVLVDIDEASLTDMGPWPWPRQRVAELVEQLIGAYGASAVALDLFFSERADEAGDQRLAMLAQHGPLVMAQAFDYQGSRPLRVGQISGGVALLPGSIPASGFVANHEGFHLAAHAGNIGFVPDKDGMLRRLPMYTRFEGRSYRSLSLVLLGCCQAGAPEPALALAAEGFWRVPYTRQWNAYTVIPAADILRQRLPPNRLQGQRVLVGSSALGLSDRVATPLSRNTSGMMVHAAALSSLLDQQAGLAPQPWAGRWWASLYSLLVVLLVWLALSRLSALLNLLVLLLLSALWVPLAYWMSVHDAQLLTTGPLVANLFLLAVAVPFDWQLSQGKSRRLLGTLRQYVAQTVVDELLRRDLRDPLAPSRCEVTTLIADMEGYTGQVESLSVEQAAQLTRDFLACLTGPVIRRGGTLDKYTGDGLVAFWGAPLPVADHADLALEAAQEMLAAVRAFSLQRQGLGYPALRVRIGIESGIAMAGDFGSEFRSIYTAVGDSVNLASRLETMARDLPHDVIIGQGTAARCQRHRLQLLGEFAIRGKEKTNTLYTLPT